MSKEKLKPLTNDELADIYKNITGRSARISSIASIVRWAICHTELFKVGDDNCIYRREAV